MCVLGVAVAVKKRKSKFNDHINLPQLMSTNETK